MAEIPMEVLERGERVLGRVKWFNNAKGYGFVQSLPVPDDVMGNEMDYFVHHEQIEMEGFKTLREEQRVTFVPVSTEKGQQARAVRPA